MSETGTRAVEDFSAVPETASDEISFHRNRTTASVGADLTLLHDLFETDVLRALSIVHDCLLSRELICSGKYTCAGFFNQILHAGSSSSAPAKLAAVCMELLYQLCKKDFRGDCHLRCRHVATRFPEVSEGESAFTAVARTIARISSTIVECPEDCDSDDFDLYYARHYATYVLNFVFHTQLKGETKLESGRIAYRTGDPSRRRRLGDFDSFVRRGGVLQVVAAFAALMNDDWDDNWVDVVLDLFCSLGWDLHRGNVSGLATSIITTLQMCYDHTYGKEVIESITVKALRVLNFGLSSLPKSVVQSRAEAQVLSKHHVDTHLNLELGGLTFVAPFCSWDRLQGREVGCVDWHAMKAGEEARRSIRRDPTMMVFADECALTGKFTASLLHYLDCGSLKVQVAATDVLTSLVRCDGVRYIPLALAGGAVPELMLNLKVGLRISSGEWCTEGQEQDAELLTQATTRALAELSTAFAASSARESSSHPTPAPADATAAASSSSFAAQHVANFGTPTKKKRKSGGRKKMASSAERKKRRKETKHNSYIRAKEAAAALQNK